MQKNRLPESVIPENYNLELSVNTEKFVFSGKEKISLKIKEKTKEIILNSINLKILSACLIQDGKKSIPKIKTDIDSETLHLNFPEFVKDSVLLEIEFEGKIDDSLYGLYRSKYKNENGKEEYFFTTQLEAPHARKLFPCFDEPDKKAVFELSVRIPENLKAISNMPMLSEKKEGKTKTISFQKTPVMSTYLLYLGIGRFEFLEGSHNKTKIRIVTTPGKSHQCSFSLDLTKKFLDYFEKYSEIPYPLPKLDMIAVPDFAAGAMENWGAITFREVLLINNEKTSLGTKKEWLKLLPMNYGINGLEI